MMTLGSKIGGRTLGAMSFVLGLAAMAGAPDWATAQSRGAHVVSSEKLDLVVGKSIVIESPVAVERASIANPDTADALVLSPRQIYVSGKSIGATNLTLWRESGGVFSVFDIRVGPDLAGLKEQLHKLFPEEEYLQVTSAHDHVAISGAISSPAKLGRALAIAEAYAPEKVINLLRVGGVQQVMLEVRVAEMNRDLLRRLGVNLGFVSKTGHDFGVTTLNDLSAVVAPRDAVLLPGQAGQAQLPGLNNRPDPSHVASPPFGFVPLSVNSILRWRTGGHDWTAFVDALKDGGLVKVLAEPTLVALSGQEASFLAGGEFPYPIPQTFGTIIIEFKKFGVGLNFKPTVLADNLISVRVDPEVSELDFTNAIAIQGFIIPAITTRRASTVVELRDGQSFAIAGLIRETVRERIKKFPVLGDVPVLGTLFRSSEFQKNETELIIIVTPRLVKPLDADEQVLPTDSVVEPNDLDFYLMGKLDAREAVLPVLAPGE